MSEETQEDKQRQALADFVKAGATPELAMWLVVNAVPDPEKIVSEYVANGCVHPHDGPCFGEPKAKVEEPVVVKKKKMEFPKVTEPSLTEPTG